MSITKQMFCLTSVTTPEEGHFYDGQKLGKSYKSSLSYGNILY